MAKIIDTLNTQNFGSQTQTNSQVLNNSLDNSLNNSQVQPEKNKGLFKIPDNLLQFVPLIPLALESMTGQKIPPMGGTMSEIQQGITQLTIGLQQVITNQTQIFNRLVNLENNASNQLTNLTNQIQNIQSIRFTHEREKKEVDFHTNKHLEENYE